MRWMLRIVVLLLLLPLITLLAIALTPEHMLGHAAGKLASRNAGLEYQIDSASLDVFSASPRLALSGVRAINSEGHEVLASASFTASVKAKQWLRAKLRFSDVQLGGGPLKLVRFEDGRSNFDHWLPDGTSIDAAFSEAEVVSDTAESAESREKAFAVALVESLVELEVPDIENLLISDLGIEFDDRQMGRTINVAVNASGSTSYSESPLNVNMSGMFNELPLMATLQARSETGLNKRISEMTIVELDMEARLAEAELLLDGKADSIAGLKGLSGRFVFSAPGTIELQSLFAEPIPDIRPLQFEAQIEGQDELFLLQGIDANIGQSQIQGDVRINPTTTPVDVAANFQSENLDLNDLWNILESRPALGSASEAETQQSWLSDETFDLQPLLGQLDGALRFTADHIELDQFPLESFDIRVKIRGNQLELLPMDFGLAGGSVEAEMNMQVSDDGIFGDSQLRIRGIDMGQITRWDTFFMGAVGQLGGRANYQFEGNSLASLARAADGEMTLLISGGKLNRVIDNLVKPHKEPGIESWKELSDQAGLIKCGYLQALSESGASQIEHLVLDSETTVFLIEGGFDANQESITLSIEPHAVDPGGSDELAVLAVQAKPGEIKFQALEQTPSRDAAIAKLKQIASPAAALLPLLGSGEEEVCYGLVSSLDE